MVLAVLRDRGYGCRLPLFRHVNRTLAPPKGPADGRGHRKRGGANAGGLSGGRNAQLIGLPCGSDGCAITPSGVRGVLNDAISLYFVDPPLANAFAARWYAGSTAEGGRRRVPSARG